MFLQQFLVWTFLGPLLPAERVLYLPIVNIIKKTLLNIFVVKLLFLNIPPFLSTLKALILTSDVLRRLSRGDDA